jgi:hypothetical protein
VGDTQLKWAYFDAGNAGVVGVKIEEHGKMPGHVVVFIIRRKILAVLVMKRG